MLKQLEDYAATQGLLGVSVEEAMATNEVVEIQQEDSTQVVVEDGGVQDDLAKLLQEYNQMAMEGAVRWLRSQCMQAATKSTAAKTAWAVRRKRKRDGAEACMQHGTTTATVAQCVTKGNQEL